MSNLETQYVTVEANVTLARVAIPSDADTTSGYYITYLVATEANGGGFSGQSWLLEDPGNPFSGFDFSLYVSPVSDNIDENIVALYNKFGNLNVVFQSWGDRVEALERSNFCNRLMNNPEYHPGCITLA